MTSLREYIRRMFATKNPLPPGLYHYQAPDDDPLNYRLHLRLEQDGSGILVVNASTILHLNQTAAEYAYHLVKQTDIDDIATSMSKRYQASFSQISQDYQDFKFRIDTLINTQDLDPEIFLDLERAEPETITVPLRLDCALTYQLPEVINPIYAPKSRASRELSTQEWIKIIDKSWNVGIPHIIFTGGEPTIREDLVTLISHAESNGQVTGLMTDGIKLLDTTYRTNLLNSGLDHLMLLLQPDLDESWSSLKAILDEDIFVVVHVTLTAENVDKIASILSRIAEMGGENLSLTTNDKSFADKLSSASEQASQLDIKTYWDLPVPFSAFNPVSLELENEDRTPNQTGLYVEPDGDVCTSQDDETLLGNVVENSWEQIWSKRTSASVVG